MLYVSTPTRTGPILRTRLSCFPRTPQSAPCAGMCLPSAPAPTVSLKTPGQACLPSTAVPRQQQCKTADMAPQHAEQAQRRQGRDTGCVHVRRQCRAVAMPARSNQPCTACTSVTPRPTALASAPLPHASAPPLRRTADLPAESGCAAPAGGGGQAGDVQQVMVSGQAGMQLAGPDMLGRPRTRNCAAAGGAQLLSLLRTLAGRRCADGAQVRRQAARLAHAVPGNKARHRYADGAASGSARGATLGTAGFRWIAAVPAHHPAQPNDASASPRPAEAAAGLAGGVAHVACLVRGRQRVEQRGIRAQKLRRQPGGRGGRLRGCVH